MSFGVKKEKFDKVNTIGLLVAVMIIVMGPQILEYMLNARAGLLDYFLFTALGVFVYWLILKITKKQPYKKGGKESLGV